VWPIADYPYLRSSADDVHDADEPWTIELPLGDVQRALQRAGFEGRRLRDVRIAARNSSGRVTRLKLSGLKPDVVSGAEFRTAIGAAELRSTSFEIRKDDEKLRVTGHGYGHGVGMCVIGAGRRAARGDSVHAILGQYYPGLAIIHLRPDAPGPVAPLLARGPVPGPAQRVDARGVDPFVPSATSTVALAASLPTTASTGGAPVAANPGTPAASPTSGAVPRAAASPVAASRVSAVAVRVPPAAPVTAAELERIGARAHDDLSKVLGTSVAPVTIQLHETLDAFRSATGRPWWMSFTAAGNVIDRAPAGVLADRDGLVATVRVAVADLLVASKLSDRPVWVRVGAARYFGRPGGAAASRDTGRVRCPADPELLLAVSAPAQRDAEKRAEACFARALARGQDWRAVR
jgi:hypothetical protein